MTRISGEIVRMRQSIGEDEKACPVCGMKVPVSDRFCVKCGWKFYPAHAVNGKGDERLLLVMKNNWKSLKGWSDMYNRYVEDANRRQREAETEISQMKIEMEKRDRRIESLQSEIEAMAKAGSQMAKGEEAKEQAARQMEEKKQEVSAEKVRTFEVGDVKFNMLMVPKGTFWMGANDDDKEAFVDEKPIHRTVLTKDYYLGETQVTQALWKAVMGNNPSEFEGDERPVENVNWNQCQQFIDKLSKKTGVKFRMPTEAEWEYAAKCGDTENYKYSGGDDLDDVAWYYNNSERETHDVKQKSPNSFGLYDMTGNVSEWVNDWKSGYNEGEVKDPTGFKVGSFKVFKGGSWYDFGSRCRVSYRGNASASRCSHDVGLRLAMNV